ncbi:Na(+)/H(+) antiporter subunit C [Canibacter sp. lx-72]|uniref:Na(+)/H(+) antiporter subunit C n=1 Tax=Canibacter zhuwentaonis TaxID=2837491 RepID=UPI001BDBD815|nr:Na(+)/H(+) antiporter subunit C [Canibacter zhuwentaonis]MBT1018223.1 Na(+)/H(+) antiporter subunit C [Canibacter zhuwentaonis]MBT1035233.1 Na(+)/H(+) antiporter subunit C [Canibacter zhuwentaonis]
MVTSVSLVLILAMVVLYAVGFTLLLDRGLTRILLGFLLVGNATNLLLFIMSGSFGAAPIAGDAPDSEISDPLPQAFILTAIVITFAVSAFLLALIYRSFRHVDNQGDSVRDDEEDRDVARLDNATELVNDAELDQVSDFDADGDGLDDRVTSPQPVISEAAAARNRDDRNGV